MYRESDFTKEVYSARDVATILNKSIKTIQKYDNEGRLKFQRTDTNRRIIFKKDLIEYLIKCNMYKEDEFDSNKRDVIYARVSSREQKEKGDLDRQVMSIIENYELYKPLIYKEVASGMNDNRPKLLKLIKQVANNEVNKVYITYKDRLTRNGFNYIYTMFKELGVYIIIVNDSEDEKLKKSH